VPTQPESQVHYAFGPFEVNASEGELRKGDVRLRLSGQPLQILLSLLAHSGEVVTREQLRKGIWGETTFVDFEHGLNAAMNKLRRALGDSAEKPRYIETVPGRGYRFIASVQQHGLPRTAASVPVEIRPAAAHPASKKIWLAAGATIGALSVISVVIWLAMYRPTRPEVRVRQLTTNSVENPIYHAVISPQGNYLAYGDSAGIHLRVISTGESHLLPKPPTLSADDVQFPVAWFPDGIRILAIAQGQATSIWSISTIGGTAYRVRENAIAASVSPDATLIAFITGNSLVSPHNRPSVMSSEVWVMGPRGENARRVIGGDAGTYYGSVRWSPDGKRIAYRRLSMATRAYAEYTLETLSLSGGLPSVLIASRESHFVTGVSLDVGFDDNFCWTRDGRIIYARHESEPNHRDRNLWAIEVNSKTGQARGGPRRLTKLAGFKMDNLSLTADNSRLAFESGSDQSNVYVAPILPSGELETPRRLTFDQRYNSPYAWTPDSKAVLFRSDRTGAYSIYKQALDQGEAELIPTGSESIAEARMSPGGKWLLYTALANVNHPDESEFTRVMRLALGGGAAERLFEISATEVTISCGVRSGAACVVSETDPKTGRVQFQTFDPDTGKRDPMFQVLAAGTKRANWSLSPSGLHIAMVGTGSHGGVEVRSLTGRVERTMYSQTWPDPLMIDWSGDDSAVIVDHFGLMQSPSGPVGVTLLRVALNGTVQPLWDTRAGRHAWAISSPDGRYLAIRAPAVERNVWMVENF
jgi:DNA-binding winged helix-turn-helix (wHTH) protein/Tol biopolymer transport system component